MNRDFRDLLLALSAAGVEFMVVGAYALAAHGLSRSTGDLDIWVRANKENSARLWQALQKFGAPLRSLTITDFEDPNIVFRMGVPPYQIDILTSITGITFDEAWPNRVLHEVEGTTVPVIGTLDQIRNKRSTDRPKDKLDADWLEKREREKLG